MDENEEITRRLGRIKAENEWIRANPENPSCRGCNRRELADKLTGGICVECQDTVNYLRTGCRFAETSGCTHPDCQMPLDPDEYPLVEMFNRGEIQ
jgi:hypothetical protein